MHSSQKQKSTTTTTATATTLTTTAANDDITLLWGVNVIASVVGTVLTAISSMVIGFNGNLLVGLGVYLAALTSAIAAARITTKSKSQSGGY
jgi:branched-subunit amino acid permease